jgi:hypothetical protein
MRPTSFREPVGTNHLPGNGTRAACRFTVARLDRYHAGTLDPRQGVLVRSHLDLCPVCRMRLRELGTAQAPGAA